jgi:lysophospholipid acyltransferase (LPLAT)-like uncharacterized protein
VSWVRHPLAMAVAERLGSAFIGVLGRTLRFEIEGRETWKALHARGEVVIFVFWHSRILPLAHLHRDEGAVVLISEHRDGELIARIIRRRGFGTARGSSTRGGARGLRTLLKALRDGRDLAITPDGPRGPARRMKLGPLVAARLSGAPIIPVAVGGEDVWRVRSWDRFVVPRPFARLKVRYGAPIRIPRQATADELEGFAAHLDAVVNALTDEVDGMNPDPVRPDRPWHPPSEDGES